MLYIDYSWDCSPSGIILDEEFNADKLGWRDGDYFQLILLREMRGCVQCAAQ